MTAATPSRARSSTADAIHPDAAPSGQSEGVPLGRMHQALLRIVVEGVVVQDAEGVVIGANPAACDILGLSTDELTGRTSMDPRWRSIDEQGLPLPGESHPAMIALRSGEPVRDVTVGIVNAHEQPRWLRVNSVPLLGEDGRSTAVISGFTDTTEIQEATRRLTENAAELERLYADAKSAERQFEALVESAPDAAVVIDAAGAIQLVNAQTEQLFGYSRAELIGRPIEVLIPKRLRRRHPVQRAAFAASPTVRATMGVGREISALRNDGTEFPVEISLSNIPTSSGPLTTAAIRDITERNAVKAALAESHVLFELVFQNAPIGMAVIDLSPDAPGLILTVNPAMCALTGRSADELGSLKFAAILHADDASGMMIDKFILGPGEILQAEKRLIRPDGSMLWGQLGVAVMPASSGRPAYGIAMIEDITARKRETDALLHQSLHDPLTGLAGRNLLRDRIAHALAAATRSRTRVGVLYIDLDGFKRVNDTAGHAAGDELLRQVGQRLLHAVRPGDTVARLGGDEFAIVCVNVTDQESLRAAATRILVLLAEPFVLSAGTHHISGSIGVRLSEPGTDTDEMVDDADAAMYQAKKAGRNRLAPPRSEAGPLVESHPTDPSGVGGASSELSRGAGRSHRSVCVSCGPPESCSDEARRGTRR